MFAAAAGAGAEGAEPRVEAENVVRVQFFPLKEAVDHPMVSCEKKPLISGVTAWSNGSIKIGVDDDGDCYPCSWMLSVFLWAVQKKGSIADFETKLLGHRSADGAFRLVPEQYRVYLKQFLAFVSKRREAWEGLDPNSETVSHDMVVQVIEALQYAPASCASGGGTEETPLHLQLKWGMGLAGRALDVHWGSQNTFPGELDDLATIGQSVEFDVGADYVGGGSDEEAMSEAPKSDMMRPGCGLEYVIGMEAEFMLESGEANPMDYTQAFTSAANGRRGASQPVVEGVRVVKLGLNHYEVRLDPGTLAEHLACIFRVDLQEGDERALAKMRRNAEWQRLNEIEPDWAAILSPEELEANQSAGQPMPGAKEATAGKGPGPSVAAAASSEGKGPPPETDNIHPDLAYARSLLKSEKDAAERRQHADLAASIQLARALEEEEKAHSSDKATVERPGSSSDEPPWKTVKARPQGKKRGKKQKPVVKFGGGGRRR